MAERDDFVAALTEAGDGLPDASVRVVEVETVAEARTALQGEDAGRVVVVGPDAETLAAAFESATNGRQSVVAVPVSDDWHDALSQCLHAVVDGWQTAQLLRSEQDRLTDALDALDDVFYIYDADGRLVRWNSRLNDVFGLDDVELAGLRADAFFVDTSRERVRNAAREALAGNDVVVEADAETELGTVRFELTGRPLIDDDGQVVGFSGVARDVTQSRRTRERLAQENEDLDAFGRVLTHDLRNPLGVATGYLEQHRESDDSPELRRVARALERMDDLIDEVRSSSRDAHLSRSTVALADVVQQAWDAVETRDALLVVDTWASVEANPRRLQRLLENLFRNCVEHAGAAPTVRVGDFDGGFFVADDGPGVPDELREDVFRTGFTTASGGTGYGLSIVRELAGMHGWRVDVTTDPSGGARFAVHGVDIDRANADADRGVSERADGRDRAS
ncbi:ATP-binding protein [Salinigranum rubrum]|uniref:ATP-binding protein n=1 Tax=Salinigranum rubrum TaxID=755307 RepID=UPI0013A52BC0|nr:PAS domain-containing sensor histidine kinase [Salinigranum rubrum]